MNAKRFEQRVLSVVKRKRLWAAGDVVTLAVSGGVDSMVLLDVLVRTLRSHKGKLQVVTFNHGFRKESIEEVQFVHQVCLHHRIPCIIHDLHLKKGPNKQERARQARRRFLLEQDGVIATAHHGSDQAETVLFRMLRGSGLDGLKGMSVLSDRWVKPLLMEFKDDILNYANERGIEWREDQSNAESTRGIIRQFWAQLAMVHPKPEKTLANLSRMLSRDADCLDMQASNALQNVVNDNQILLHKLREHHPAIQVRILRRWLWENNVGASGHQIDLLLDWQPSRNGAFFQLDGSTKIQQITSRWSLC